MNNIKVKLFRGLMVMLSRLPLKFHYFVCGGLAWILKNVVRYRTGVVWMNISRSFPNKSYWELKNIYNAFYRHLGEIFAEAIWFSGSDYARLDKQKIVTVRNPEVLSDIYEKSPSVTVLCSHCGNWELLGGVIGYMNADGFKCSFTEHDITVVYKKLSNEVSDRVFAMNRNSPIHEVGLECQVESKNILRYCINHRAEKRVYAYPADQAPYKGMGRHDIGMFLNQHTYAMTGSVGVACKLSHAVVYVKMRHLERGRYEWEFIPICDDASTHTPEELIRKYYDHLEDEINETPYNWLWSHNRWKIY